MTKFTVVLPYVYQEYKDACESTMAPEFRASTLFVDNTKTNMGIMWSHNRGVEAMMRTGSDWLIILGASIRFGEPGGMDFIEELDKRFDHHVVEATPVYGWHLIAFSRDCLKRVGKWDENFSPYSLCDIDMSLRIQKAYKLDSTINTPKWEKAKVDATDEGMAHGINKTGVKAAYDPRNAYFIRKWGRGGGEYEKEAYDHPFNEPEAPLWYWPEAVDPNSIWRNEYESGKWKYDE